MYYIEKGLGMKWLAVLFSLVAGFACFGIGNISQSSEIAGAMEGLFGMSGLTTGVLLAVVVGIVVLGGVQRIGPGDLLHGALHGHLLHWGGAGGDPAADRPSAGGPGLHLHQRLQL